mgnify:CR=1 FL=1
MDRVWLKGGYEMEKQRDNHIEQNVTEQHTTEQGGIYRKIRDFALDETGVGVIETCAHPGGPGKSCDRF